MKKLLKIFAVMFIVSVALLAVAAYVPNGDVADAVTADCTHEYSEVVLAQQPSCTQKGWLEYYTCTLCGKYFVKVGEDMVEVDWEDISSPVLVHKWSDWFVKPATCTEDGGEMRYCALCGATEHRGETIDATGHNLTHHEAVASTCEVAGNSEYWSCDRCGLYFSDSQGSQPIEENSWILPLAKHTEETIPGKAATCTETGLTDGVKCSVCGTVLVAQQEIPATGHTYDAVKTENNVCTVCEQEITQAEIVEKLYALESGEALDGTYLLTGIVTNLDGTNATIIVEEKEILYSFQSTDAFLVGDRVSVVGTLKHFGNYYEFDKGTVTKVTHPEYTLTFGANVEGYTVTLADGSSVPTSAPNGTTYEVKITVPKGYKVANVTVNGAAVDMSESGTYSVTVCGETTVQVEIVSKMSQQEVALTFPDGNSAEISSYTNEWSVTLGENTWNITNANNNKNGWDYIRIGAKSSTSTSTISFTSEKSVSKIVVYTAYIRGSATATLSVVNSQGETIFSTEAQAITDGTTSIAFEVSGAEQNCTYVLTFVCTNTNSKNGVIDISKVTYTSVVCEHEWRAWAHKSDATCTESETESRICKLCGAEEVRTVGEPLGHTWGEWKSNGNGTHTGTCTREGCDYTVKENCTFENGVCSVCGAQEVVTHSVTVGYTVNGNSAITLPEGVTVEILGKDGQPVTDLANVVEGTITIKVTAEGFDIVVTCNDTHVTMDGGAGTFDLKADATLSVTLTTQTEHKGTAEDPYSVADALALASAIGQGNYTEKVYIKGLVIYAGEKKGSYLSNIYIADTADGTKMLVFSANFSQTVATIYEGDTVVFHGYITNYNGTLEIAGKDGDYVYMTAVTRGSRPIAVKMENATTTDLPESAPIESTVTFTVTASEGYEIVSVKVNDISITAVDGKYSFVVGETNNVVVTTQVIKPKHQVSVSGDAEGYTVTTESGSTLPGEVSEGELKFTVTAPEGYQVATVFVGDTVLTLGDDGYYTTEVADEITINITFSEIVVLPTELLTELTFPDDNQVNNKVNAYDKTWTAIKDGHEWTISNFNNNNWNNSWTYIKAGRKSDPSTAAITIPFAEQISKVVVTVDKVTAEKINSFKLIVATDKEFENIVEEVKVQPIVTGDIEFALTKPGANLYYKIEIDCPAAGSNGIIQISKVAYWHVVCDHVWGDWETVTSPTCTEAGEQQRTCTKCNAVESQTIEPLGHSIEWKSNGDNTHTGTCSLCGETVTEDCTFVDGQCTVCHDELTTISVAKALEMLSAGETSAKQYVTGIVTAKPEYDSKHDSYSFNIRDLTDETKEIYVYSSTLPQGIVLYQGDTVVVSGYLKQYNGKDEIANGTDGYPVLVQRTVGTSPITAEENENVTVTLSASQGENGSEFSFTIAIDTEGYTITSVMANGKEVTADEDGTYRAIVEGPTVVIVVGRVEGTSPTAFVKITDQNTFENAVASGAKFLIVYEDVNTAYVFDGSLTKLDAANNYVTAKIENGQIADSAELQASSFAITASASGYNIQSASGLYIGSTKNDNRLDSDNVEPFNNTISLQNDSSCDLVSSSAHLRFNMNTPYRFRYYKSSSYTNQKAVCLYALI